MGWTDNKDDFILSITEGEWAISTEDGLFFREMLPAGTKVKKSFLICSRCVYHTTDWLRFFCHEHHPEVDFDKEFDTHKPGVFSRYQDRFGHDYEEHAMQQKYDLLKEELKKAGYKLPWEDESNGQSGQPRLYLVKTSEGKI